MYAAKTLACLVLVSCVGVSHGAITVGTCESTKHPYQTISAAIAAAPANSVVDVCPGTYPEQLAITKPLTIRGVLSGVNIVPPSTGLTAFPANSDIYPQIFVNAKGAVALSNLSLNGNARGIRTPGGLLSLAAACQDGQLGDYAAVYFLNTPGAVEHLNISGYFVSGFAPGDPEPQFIPNCGSGIEFIDASDAIVRNTVIGETGLYGIYSTGDLTADRNVVSGGFGPYGVGIMSGSDGTITENTITGTLRYRDTVGIQGGNLVRGNVVQSVLIGIAGASKVRHNTMLNNAVGLSRIGEAADNLITAPSTYMDPTCQNFSCGNFGVKPTIGIDVACESASSMKDNGIVGVGIGFANVEAGQTISPTDLFANVTTKSTICTP